MRVYNHKLQVNFEIRSGWMIFGRWGLKFDQIFSCHHFISSMIWDIDLIFGMKVFNHKLQINVEIHSGWMIFGQLTAVGLWNLAKYLVVTTFFFTIIWDIDLIFGMWVYSDELPIKFEFRSDWMIWANLRTLDF